MLTMRQMHQRFHDSTGVTFASLYPGAWGQGLPSLGYRATVVAQELMLLRGDIAGLQCSPRVQCSSKELPTTAAQCLPGRPLACCARGMRAHPQAP